MLHSDVGSDRLQRLFEIRPVVAKDRLRQPDYRHSIVMLSFALLRRSGHADPTARASPDCASLWEVTAGEFV